MKEQRFSVKISRYLHLPDFGYLMTNKIIVPPPHKKTFEIINIILIFFPHWYLRYFYASILLILLWLLVYVTNFDILLVWSIKQGKGECVTVWCFWYALSCDNRNKHQHLCHLSCQQYNINNRATSISPTDISMIDSSSHNKQYKHSQLFLHMHEVSTINFHCWRKSGMCKGLSLLVWASGKLSDVVSQCNNQWWTVDVFVQPSHKVTLLGMDQKEVQHRKNWRRNNRLWK